MTRKNFVRISIAAAAVAALTVTGLVYAHQRGGELLLGRRLTHELTRAGVEPARVESIVLQARTHRAELLEIYRSRKAALGEIAAMSPDQGAAVQAKVQQLLDSQQKDRETLRGIVQEISAQLTPREKANVVLKVADRLPRFGRDCGSRVDDLVERLQDNEVLDATDAQTLQSELNRASPELCSARDALRADVKTLRDAVSKKETTDADLETLLAHLKQTHQSAAALRSETLRTVAAELSPAGQIAVAGRLLRLHAAAEALMGM